jgi:hypothetical protein
MHTQPRPARPITRLLYLARGMAEVPFRAYRTWSHNVTSEPS